MADSKRGNCDCFDCGCQAEGVCLCGEKCKCGKGCECGKDCKCGTECDCGMNCRADEESASGIQEDHVKEG